MITLLMTAPVNRIPISGNRARCMRRKGCQNETNSPPSAGTLLLRYARTRSHDRGSRPDGRLQGCSRASTIDGTLSSLSFPAARPVRHGPLLSTCVHESPGLADAAILRVKRRHQRGTLAKDLALTWNATSGQPISVGEVPLTEVENASIGVIYVVDGRRMDSFPAPVFFTNHASARP